jgi:hypothetical protein
MMKVSIASPIVDQQSAITGVGRVTWTWTANCRTAISYRYFAVRRCHGETARLGHKPAPTRHWSGLLRVGKSARTRTRGNPWCDPYRLANPLRLHPQPFHPPPLPHLHQHSNCPPASPSSPQVSCSLNSVSPISRTLHGQQQCFSNPDVRPGSSSSRPACGYLSFLRRQRSRWRFFQRSCHEQR